MDEYSNVEIGFCRMVMNMLGLWPKERSFAVSVRYVAVLGVIVGFCDFPQTVKLIRVRDNFDQVMEILTNFDITNSTIVILSLIFWSNRKERNGKHVFLTEDLIKGLIIKNEALGWLLDVMAADWAAAKTEMEKKVMQKNARLSRLISIMVVFSCESSVFSLLVVNGHERWKESKLFEQGKINASDRLRPMYFSSEFAYDVQKTPYYEITWILQFFSTMFAATTFVATVAFFSALVLHLCAQMRNLRGQMKTLLDEATQQNRQPTVLDLSIIVKRHKFLMSFAQTIEDTFNMQFLVQLLSSFLIFCFTGYQIVEIVTNDEIFIFNLMFAFYYYATFNGTLFLLSYIATILRTESTKLGEVAYNSQWYELRPADARLLILIMIRTQQPFELTAGKFVSISLGLYCSVLKTSAGYMSMLMAVKK